jgi:hypothetical protein
MLAGELTVAAAIGIGLFSMSAAGAGTIASDQPPSITGLSPELTMMRVVPYPDETDRSSRGVPPTAYSCYRVGRCSAYDLYRFRDRPNRLTRLAPQAPGERVARPPSILYLGVGVPITPDENILPKYRTASQVRDEYRTAGRPIDDVRD